MYLFISVPLFSSDTYILHGAISESVDWIFTVNSNSNGFGGHKTGQT